METTPKTHVLTPCRHAFAPQKKQISVHQHKKHKVGCPLKNLTFKTRYRVQPSKQENISQNSCRESRLYNNQWIFLVKGGRSRTHSIYCNPVSRQYKYVYTYIYIDIIYACTDPQKNGLAKLPIWVRVFLYLCNDINTLHTNPFPIAIFQVPKITSL